MKFRKLFYKPLFLHPLVDEISLDQNARNWLARQSPPLNDTIFAGLHHELDLDLATRILYQYFIENKHRNFFELINKIPVTLFSNEKRIKLIIIPGMYYREHPEIGADGKLIVDIAHQLGFNIEYINVHSLGSIKRNAELIHQALLKSSEEEVWLVSLSKGSLEVRLCLQQWMQHNFPINLRGWINVGGIYFGTQLANIARSTISRRVLSRIMGHLLGIQPEVVLEISANYSEWRQNLIFPDHFTQIHTVGMPLACHIHKSLQKRYQRLSEFGPNDGMILLTDYLRLGGFVYPLWGVDHLMRYTKISELLYKLFYVINFKLYKEIKNEKMVSNNIVGVNNLGYSSDSCGSI